MNSYESAVNYLHSTLNCDFEIELQVFVGVN